MKFTALAITALVGAVSADFFSANFVPTKYKEVNTAVLSANYINPTALNEAGLGCGMGNGVLINSIDWLYFNNCTDNVAAHFGLSKDGSSLDYIIKNPKTVYPCVETTTPKNATFTNFVCSDAFNLPSSVTVAYPKTTPFNVSPASSAAKAGATCTAGFSGKKNGNGPTGACCTHSDDCHETCYQGACKTF
ncbi:hypothetical protein INT43_008087 [Umbelopsis isabellina]|uniref:Uncharacterized protein n=1 Tax=Mortierella isabellina TaxID=91625 RepID=A0A8H7PD61_MORIS|nr:hypothetical protein INT43_008087 [Umbelopsis isabellina]